MNKYLPTDLANIVYDYARERPYLEDIQWGNFAKYSYIRSTDELYYNGLSGFGIIYFTFDKESALLGKMKHYQLQV